jgi:Ca-activated chloride channel family protein
VLAVVVALDPAVEGGVSEARQAAADVLFVIDSTASMGAVDHPDHPTRLDGVRADVADLAAGFPGARFSLIRFDSVARVELPWTTDVDALAAAVTVMRPERAIYSSGSLLDRPLDLMADQLDGAGPSGGRRYSVVFFMSDGEQRRDLDAEAGTGSGAVTVAEGTAELLSGIDTDRPQVESFEQLAPLVDGGAVLGYGTPEGGPMVEFVGREGVADVDEDTYVVDPATGEPGVSRLDEASLVEAAEEMDVPYVARSTGSAGGLGDLANSIVDDAPVVSAGAREAPRRLYWLAAAGVLLVVLWQASATVREALGATRLFGAPDRRPST